MKCQKVAVYFAASRKKPPKGLPPSSPPSPLSSILIIFLVVLSQQLRLTRVLAAEVTSHQFRSFVNFFPLTSSPISEEMTQDTVWRTLARPFGARVEKAPESCSCLPKYHHPNGARWPETDHVNTVATSPAK